MSRTSQFLMGLQKLGDGFGFLATHKHLWPWVFIPLAIGLILLCTGWILFLNNLEVASYFLLKLLGVDKLSLGQTWYAMWLLKPVVWILKIVFNLMVTVLGLILCSLLSFVIYLVVAAPFLDLLAEKTTLAYKGEEPPPFAIKLFFKNVLRTMAVESQKALLFLIIPLLLWILIFVPVIGTFLYIGLTYFFGIWALAFVTVDYPMGHKMMPFGERLKFGRKHKWTLLGFGLPFLVPFAPLLLQAPMVVGGTLLYHTLTTRQK